MTDLVFIDTETTGLDPRIHQPYEVAFWGEGDDEPIAGWLEHALTFADRQALEVGGYWRRHADRALAGGTAHTLSPGYLITALRGSTLVGSNPGFDAAMLRRFIGTEVWHHRHIDVSDGAMWVFGWDRPKGLADTAAALRAEGFEIPEPDHTATGDVRATRAVYYALRQLRERR